MRITSILKRLLLAPLLLLTGIPEGGAGDPPPAGEPKPATGQTAAPGAPTQNYDEIFAKLDSILEKRSDGVAKSALKDNGIDDAEIKDIMAAYRSQKQQQATRQTEQLTTLQSENEQLKAQIAQTKLQNAASSAAMEMGVDAATIPYLTRMADLTGALGDSGEPDAAKITAALKKVLDDVPALKGAAASKPSGFVPVGAKTGTGQPGDEADAKLRQAFGLK